jgi:hypothetical protein
VRVDQCVSAFRAMEVRVSSGPSNDRHVTSWVVMCVVFLHSRCPASEVAGVGGGGHLAPA